jgi:hypothetical protein
VGRRALSWARPSESGAPRRTSAGCGALRHRGTNGVISLREAVCAANNTAGADIITLPSGTYQLTRTGDDNTASNGDLDINTDITIKGGSCTSAGTCTGGAIQGSTGAGINLTSTGAISLTNVDVENGSDDGIRGVTVNGFTLANSRIANNDTLLILNRLGGNLGTSAGTLSSIFGLLYDGAENAISFRLNATTCQLRSSLSNNFPRTAPRFETFLPAGRSGWLKLWSTAGNFAVSGSVSNFSATGDAMAVALNQGHNLHKLTLRAEMVYTIPAFPPSC